MATRRRRQTQPTNEILGMVVSCIGGYAILFGISPTIANGTIGLFLIGGAILSSILYIIIGLRNGRQVFRSIIELLIVSLIAFVTVYGCIWYFTVYLASQSNLFNFSIHSSTPKRIP